jgi:hypothetical protein
MSEPKVKTKQLKPNKATEFSAQESAQASTQVTPRIGRPTLFTEEMADEICSRIVQGESLNRICKDDHMPEVRSVYRWLRSNDAFCQLYARAKEDQADTLADEIQDISDERPMLTIMTDDETVEKLDPVGINRNRLRVDARKWIASKLKPKKYGDRQILAGDPDNPLEIKQQSEMLEALLVNIERKRQSK